MKFVIDNNKFVVFLNKKFDLDDKIKLEKYFKELFHKLKNKYNIEVNGYYNIDIYADKYYGTIIEMENEDLEYYTYFNQIDMEINVFKSNFYYEINYNFLDKNILNKVVCYKYNDKIYLKIKEDIDEITLSKLLEYSNVLYGEEVEKITKYGKKVNL